MPTSGRSLLAAGVEIALVFLVFAAYAGYPIPEPNEPHYLCKAKHFWNPAWIADDFFLDSSDSHWVFYVTCGWITQFVSLPAAAALGRLVTWALMAAAWRHLSTAIVPRRGAAILSALLFVALSENFHMAGEWAIGGWEAKSVAYVFVFAGLGELLRQRLNSAWILFGGAAALHVVVGGWAMIAALFSLIGPRRAWPSAAQVLPGMAVGSLLALIGLVPALRLTAGVDPLTVREANYLYVYERLPHHLFFYLMPASMRQRFAVLLIVWVALNRFFPPHEAARRLRRFVVASLIFVVIGIGLSLLGASSPDSAATLLRYYWFRLADVLLPLGTAIELTDAAYRLGVARPWRRVGLIAALVALSCILLRPQIAARLHPGVPRADKSGKVADYESWRDVCAWIAANTPADARFITPRSAQTFKWYAGRSEVATWKDLPQDAPSIVAWWDRLDDVYGGADPPLRWQKKVADIGAAKLRELGTKYDARYVLSEAEPPLDLPCVYRNAAYAVYELPKE